MITPPPPGELLHHGRWKSVHGIHTRRLASSEFRRVFRGYYTPASAPATLNEMCRVVQEKLLPGSLISGPTAAALYGAPLPITFEGAISLLVGAATTAGGDNATEDSGAPPTNGPGPPPLPGDGPVAEAPVLAPRGYVLEVPSVLPSALMSRDPDTPGPASDVDSADDSSDSSSERLIVPEFPVVHVRVPRNERVRSTCFGMVVHRDGLEHGIETDGLRILHPLELLRELASLLPLWDVVVVIDWLVSERAPGTITLTQVCTHARRPSSEPGTELLREAAALARGGVLSPMETYVRLLVTAAGFTEPTPNIVVRVPDRSPRTRKIDNGWEEYKVGLEYNGDYHRSLRGQWRKDERRRDDLRSVGWELRDQTILDIRDPLSSLLGLRTALAERGAAVPSVQHLRAFCVAFRKNPPTLLLTRVRTA